MEVRKIWAPEPAHIFGSSKCTTGLSDSRQASQLSWIDSIPNPDSKYINLFALFSESSHGIESGIGRLLKIILITKGGLNNSMGF